MPKSESMAKLVNQAAGRTVIGDTEHLPAERLGAERVRDVVLRDVEDDGAPGPTTAATVSNVSCPDIRTAESADETIIVS